MVQWPELAVGTGYSALPPVYDRWQRSYGSDYTTLIVPRLRATLATLNLPPGSMVDLACGTGSLAMVMARDGWQVTGIDASPGMILQARRKAMREQRSVSFLRQDMRTFHTGTRVDLITCMFDSLNHLLTLRDLRRALVAAHRNLRSGGYFVFDLNNERCYLRHWRGDAAMHGRDFAVILESRYDRRRRLGTIDVTVFDREGKGFRRERERVRERYYPRAEVRSALQAAGFKNIRAREFNFTPHPEFGPLKTWWVAQAR